MNSPETKPTEPNVILSAGRFSLTAGAFSLDVHDATIGVLWAVCCARTAPSCARMASYLGDDAKINVYKKQRLDAQMI
jgi:hypothetical protein